MTYLIGAVLTSILLWLNVWPSPAVISRAQQRLDRDGDQSFLRDTLLGLAPNTTASAALRPRPPADPLSVPVSDPLPEPQRNTKDLLHDQQQRMAPRPSSPWRPRRRGLLPRRPRAPNACSR